MSGRVRNILRMFDSGDFLPAEGSFPADFRKRQTNQFLELIEFLLNAREATHDQERRQQIGNEDADCDEG